MEYNKNHTPGPGLKKNGSKKGGKLLLGILGEAKFVGDMHLLPTRKLGTGTPGIWRDVFLGMEVLGKHLFGWRKMAKKNGKQLL